MTFASPIKIGTNAYDGYCSLGIIKYIQRLFSISVSAFILHLIRIHDTDASTVSITAKYIAAANRRTMVQTDCRHPFGYSLLFR